MEMMTSDDAVSRLTAFVNDTCLGAIAKRHTDVPLLLLLLVVNGEHVTRGRMSPVMGKS